jgi:hypothetical protein
VDYGVRPSGERTLTLGVGPGIGFGVWSYNEYTFAATAVLAVKSSDASSGDCAPWSGWPASEDGRTTLAATCLAPIRPASFA